MEIIIIEKKKAMFIGLVAAACLVMGCMGTLQQDEEECAEQLTNLASCIPFVSGNSKKPTPECCQNTQKVKTNKPKCLCVLIKESADPSMGLPVNTTLALQMPSACNINADVSDCPTILKLAADSPDAKIFKVATSSDSTTTTSTTDSPSTSSGSQATPSINGTNKRNVFGGGMILLIMGFVVFFI